MSDHHVDAANIDNCCADFEAAWKAGERPRIEDYLEQFPAASRSKVLVELLQVELWWRRHEMPPPNEASYRKRFLGYTEAVDDALEKFASASVDRSAPVDSSELESADTPFSFLDDAGISSQEFAERLIESELLARDEIEDTWNLTDKASRSVAGFAKSLASQNLLSPLQARLIISDDCVPPVLGIYVIEEELGKGGMG